MEILRSPDSCFENLAEFDFEPHFLTVTDPETGTALRMHYVDEGPGDAKPLVMIHGNPTWSYEWRNVIPLVVAAGYRAIAIDLIGTGRSDKPSQMHDYSIARHVEWTRQALFEQLDLHDAVFVMHDWGGIIGPRVIAADMSRVSHVVYSNTGLPCREPGKPIAKMRRKPALLSVFQWWIRYNRGWKFWNTIKRTCVRPVRPEVIASYAAPYPEKKYLVGHRQFTQMLPTRNDNPMLTDNWHAMEILKNFDKPWLCLFSDKDIVAPRGHQYIRKHIPGAARFETMILHNASHFLSEDAPQEYAEAMLAWLRENGGASTMTEQQNV